MAITTKTPKYGTGSNGETIVVGHDEKVTFVGRVLEIKRVEESRNHSDTLDYTDFRTTLCTKALVWLGTEGSVKYDEKPRALEFYEQFKWIDCSNLFAWRGAPTLVPEVDASLANGTGEPLMWVNYLAWQAYEKAQAESLAVACQKAADAAREARLKVETARARRAALTPRKGDKVVVSRGRVNKGATGIAAYVTDDRVLIKQPHEWQDRKANGVWARLANCDRATV